MNSDNFYAQIHLTLTNIYIKKRLFSRPRSNDTHSLFVATSCYWYGYVKRRTTVIFSATDNHGRQNHDEAHWSSTRICCDWFWKIEWPLIHAVSQWGGFRFKISGLPKIWNFLDIRLAGVLLQDFFFWNCSMLNFFTKIRHFERLTSVNVWVTRIFLFSSAGSNLYSRKLSQ